MNPSKRSVVAAVGRRLVPQLVEATLIPTLVFYAALAGFGLRVALLSALGWSYTAVLRRLVRRRRVPVLLLMATVGITVRVVVYASSGSTFVYFLQPILGTTVVAGAFAMSVLVGRPLIGRFANDFCPLTRDVQLLPAVTQLFRRLTYLWAGVNLTIAVTNITLLITVPVPVFVGARMVAAWIITITGIVMTVRDSVHTARAEGLHTAVSPNGVLHAFVPTAL